MVFSAALSVATGIVFGLFPALNSTRSDLIGAIRSGAGQVAGGRSAACLREGLVTAAVTTFAADAVPHVVTEFMRTGATFRMDFVPTHEGRWLFHCHIVTHILPFPAGQCARACRT